jgi:hypothetical protein
MKIKDLPISVQTFENIRTGNYIYVDKTEQLFPIVSKHYGAYFLSRPRRFGKSLTVSTINELFSGNRELFKGLWIEDKWDWSKTYPVIHISFDATGYRGMGLENAIKFELKQIADQNNIIFTTDDLQQQFKELIEKLSETKGRVVILIDEYDKPIIDYLEKLEMPQAKINQGILKSFYSALKSSEKYLRMVFITGVSKFSKVSIFSDLNHLNDLTIDDTYGTLVGYTQSELEFYFEDYIQLVITKLKISREELLNNMREWYNGYSWDGENKVYNPFGILNFFDKKAFRYFWFSTGAPTFLIKLMRKSAEYDFEDHKINGILLEKYDLDNLELVPLLFQTGYLTIKEIDFMTDDMVLSYPNKEVKQSLYQFLIEDIAPSLDSTSSGVTVKNLQNAFKNNDLAQVKDIINTLFSDLPYNLHEIDKRKSERFFHGLIHLLFKYLGIFIESEVRTYKGRADSIVQTDTHVYIFEFKADKTAEEALDQLIKNGYANKYKTSGKEIINIAVNFNSKEREIDGWIEKTF